MSCYTIVTCRSALWTILTILTSLITVYCLITPEWLIGREQPVSIGTSAIKNSNTSETDNYDIIGQKNMSTELYRTTVGLFSQCRQVLTGDTQAIECSSFAGALGGSNNEYPTAWQAGLVLSGVASLLLLFVTFNSVLSICIQAMCRKSIFTITGLVQIITGLFLMITAAIYPFGWASEKVKDFCGDDADIFSIGDCRIGWAFWAEIVCTLAIFFIGMLSIQADKATSSDDIEDEILKGKRLICVL